MLSEFDKERMLLIYGILMEVARGNFSYRIQRSDQDDEIEAVIILANMMTEELQAFFRHYSYVNPHQSYQHRVRMTFILDAGYRIRYTNTKTSRLLHYKTKKLKGKPFKQVLSQSCIKVWETIKSQLEKYPRYDRTEELVFITRKQLDLPAFCTISRVEFDGKQPYSILITSMEIFSQENISGKDSNQEKETSFLRQISTSRDHIGSNVLQGRASDAQIMQEIYDYILSHFWSEIPPMKILAHSFGTNEYKLKKNFKELFGLSPFQLYQHQRLKRAILLIEKTSFSLKTIARLAGFKTYPHFSKIFKKWFGYPPREHRKRS